MRDRGVVMFGLHCDGVQVGFVAVEKATDDLYYVGRLAVLPSHRHRGLGRKLMDTACDCVSSNRGTTVSIGIIDKHAVLKKWYADYGFTETATRRFEHLPFTVCFMEREIRR